MMAIKAWRPCCGDNQVGTKAMQGHSPGQVVRCRCRCRHHCRQSAASWTRCTGPYSSCRSPCLRSLGPTLQSSSRVSPSSPTQFCVRLLQSVPHPHSLGMRPMAHRPHLYPAPSAGLPRFPVRQGSCCVTAPGAALGACPTTCNLVYAAPDYVNNWINGVLLAIMGIFAAETLAYVTCR